MSDMAMSFGRPVKTALHQAVLDHRLHQVRLIVTNYDDDVDVKDIFGRTPLMLTCLLENEDDGFRMAKIFLKAGAFVNIQDAMNRSALHYACMKGKERIVRRFLLSETAELNAPDNDGNTPLMHAALSGNPEVVRAMVECLLKFGVSVDHRNTMGYTALLLACKYGHFVSAHILVTETTASPALRDNEFLFNALEWARKSSELHSIFNQRQHRMGVDMPRFSRENTMYAISAGPVCSHVKAPTHPLGQSIDSALRLPRNFNNSNKRDMETTLDGHDAEPIVLKLIEDLLNSPKYRPVSKITRATRAVGSMYPGMRSTKPHPSTAKLSTMNPASRSRMFPDLRSLLDMYSDQYAEKLMLPTQPKGKPVVASPVKRRADSRRVSIMTNGSRRVRMMEAPTASGKKK